MTMRAHRGTSVIPSNLHGPRLPRCSAGACPRGRKWTVLVVWTLGDGPKRQRIAQGFGLHFAAHVDAHPALEA